MSLSACRTAVRAPIVRRIAARNASTTSEAANAASNAASSGAAKAKETASQVTSKASEGLTRVNSSAASAASKTAEAASSTLSSIGGRTGRLISYVQSLVPPTVYYSKVGLELAKLVANGQKMSPPNMATFQSYAQPLVNMAKSPSTIFNRAASTASSTASQAANKAANNPSSILDSLRNVDNKQLVAGGVVLAETIGFFTVGEMIGRFKVIGYRTSKSGHDEHH